MARRRRRRRHIEDSIASLNEQLRQDPDNHRTGILLGLALRDERQFAEADAGIPPGDGAGAAERRIHRLSRRDAAGAGRRTPRAPEAERLFRRALELQPGNPSARFYLATLKDSAATTGPRSTS